MNISEFLEKYIKPYNPDNDDYDIPPFQKNIDNASKSSKIYNMHMYWTKQDPYVIKQYIEYYTKPGDVVLDAFAGTGMTGVAAMMSGRHAILCDISPACIHIAKNYTTPIEPEILEKAYRELKEKIEPEIKPLYKTVCHNCGNPDAQIANTILSDVFACPRCGGEILFAGGGRWEKMKRGEKFEKINCDNCGYQFKKSQADFVRYEPIKIRVDCNRCKVKGEKKSKQLNEEDWQRYIEIEGGPTKVVRDDSNNDVWTKYQVVPADRFVSELGTAVYKKMLETVEGASDPNKSKETVGAGLAPAQHSQMVQVPIGATLVQVPIGAPLVRVPIGAPLVQVPIGGSAGSSSYWCFVGSSFTTRTTENLHIHPKEPPYWYPKDVKFFGAEPRRNLKRGITHPYQMFSRRNLIALSVLWKYIYELGDEEIRNKVMFVFTGEQYNVCLMRNWKVKTNGRPRMGTLYIGSIVEDINVFGTFITKFAHIKNGLESYSIRWSEVEPRTNKKRINTIVLTKSATELFEISPNSIDYAYYDPPYGANINYSELNIMWEAWLGEFTNTQNEIIENKSQNKDRQKYEEMMTDALKEAYRVLKPGRILTMVYSYTDETMYRTIQRIAHNAGFVDEGEILHINSTRKTNAQLDSDKTQQRYLVINFKKPRNGERKELQKSEDIELSVIQVVQDFLTASPCKTRDYIYDEVIKQLFTSVQIEKFNLDEILKNFFRKVGDEWYAPGTLIKPKIDNSPQFSLFPTTIPEHPEKEVVMQIQEFLQKHKTVPYSEIREFYLRKINIPLEKDFDELVQENFIIEQGKVRLPTPCELEKMQDIVAKKKIYDIRKYLDNPKPLSAKELFDNLIFCYENEFYLEGIKIFNLIEENSIDGKTYKKAKKIVDVCRIKV